MNTAKNTIQPARGYTVAELRNHALKMASPFPPSRLTILAASLAHAGIAPLRRVGWGR